jgi:hypothetical protein
MPDIDAAYRQAQGEILADIARGLVPANVNRFSQLHDHVDANWYGGLFDIDLDGDAQADFGNELQNRLDAWLRAERPDVAGKYVVQIPGYVEAEYVDGRISEIVFTCVASSAGYFGPSARLSEGDPNLDIEDTDGPFWRAMQTYLGPIGDEPSIRWYE